MRLRRRERHGVAVVVTTARYGGIRRELLLGEFRERHAEQREHRVRPRVGRKIESRDLRVEQVGVGWLLRSVEQLLPIDDLQHARTAGAVAEVDAIAFRTERDRSMQLGGYRH